ncbi:hypothetical protein HC028_03390 [Planosporangium flavigriseum]|uniref:Uncharacterized protein n=1 Tax=Planosporangium flavigriseum TaxID=373681 RepID=A0A8J3PJG0_9ACTN|nr:hypothetical protein [Planosporangium flavigriseum]NJC63559.1 hypothetical protein [Planosporangium flavigriseum]GIG72256.1 hypothetical protein Pfl04_06600 [Planosporangium flavigriseum]
MHDSVYELVGDDPRLAKLLRASLSKLADGPEGPLREMAEGVLSGHVDLRQAAMSDAYGDELGAAFGRFWSHYEQLDQRERDELVRQAGQQLDELLDGPRPS